MAVIGLDSIFLSHLAMFHSPHHYQVIMRVSFGSSDITYRDDRRANRDTKLYTFAPERFVLPEIFPGKAGEPPIRKSFAGSLVRNHFEQPPAHPEDPVEIASDVTVDVINVVHQHKFDPAARPLEQLTYLLFGEGSELFLAHYISRRPDFDHLVPVDVGGHGFSDDQLGHGVEVTVTGRANNEINRIQDQEKLTVVALLDGRSVPTDLCARAALYFETNDFS